MGVLQDLRYAIRLIRRSPGFSAVAIATMALAIGANSAMFSFVHGALLRPLPYPDAHRIARVLERSPAGGVTGISTLNYLDWVSQSAVFEYIAAEAGWQATLTGGDEPIAIRGARVSARYFDIFGVKAALGRTFLPDEDQPGRDRVVLLSHRLWTNRFGADPAILERGIVLNGEVYDVVGVLPRDGPWDRTATQIWKPLAFGPSSMTRDFRWLGASAKLKPGLSIGSARVGMDTIAQRLAIAHPDSNKDWGVAVDRLDDVIVGPGLETAVTTLFAATLLVLLIGGVNLANLTLARAASRDGEMAVRSAFGASRERLVRQLLIENVLMALCGGAVAIGVGYALMKWIASVIPPYALPPAVDIRMGMPVLLFTAVVSVGTGLLIGLAAAARSSSRNLARASRAGRQGTTAVSPGRRLRGVLVVAEVALAFVLLVASGLLMRSFVNLLDVDLGFEAADVLTAGLPIEPRQYPDPTGLNSYLASIRAAVQAVPGVRDTALASALPLEGWGFGTRYAVGDRQSLERGNGRSAFFKIVSPSYVSALGLTLRAGRDLSHNDIAGAPRAALINETLARREFAGTNPIGQRILVEEPVAGRSEFGQKTAWDIVGIVSDEKITGLGDEAFAGIYVSNEQSPTYSLSLIVKGDVTVEPLQKAVRSAVDRVNRNQALSDVRTLEQVVERSMLGNRVVTTLLMAFAALALLLAAIGIYGVMSCTAAERTYEMGIRVSLGASPAHLRSLILREGMRLTAVGLVIGVVGAIGAARLLSWMLYGVGAFDVTTSAMVAAAIAGVAGLACVVPARRVARVDAIGVLRS